MVGPWVHAGNITVAASSHNVVHYKLITSLRTFLDCLRLGTLAAWAPVTWPTSVPPIPTIPKPHPTASIEALNTSNRAFAEAQ